MGAAPPFFLTRIKRRIPAMGVLKPAERADGNPISNVPKSRDKDMRPSNGDLLVTLVVDIGRIGSAPQKLFRSRRPLACDGAMRARLLVVHVMPFFLPGMICAACPDAAAAHLGSCCYRWVLIVVRYSGGLTRW